MRRFFLQISEGYDAKVKWHQEIRRELEASLKKGAWSDARLLIERHLSAAPNDHWLLTRLGETYFEERAYDRALQCSFSAVAQAPRCPLVLWDYAGCLEMQGQDLLAAEIYDQLIRRGVDDIAYGECGEGKMFATSLVADCYYRISLCFDRLDRPKGAQAALMTHLDMREPGCQSIYPLMKLQHGPERKHMRLYRPLYLRRGLDV